jgi:hypothetical protein
MRMEIAEQLIYIGWTLTKLVLVVIVMFVVFNIFLIIIRTFLDGVRASSKKTKFTVAKPLDLSKMKKGGRNDPPQNLRPPPPYPFGGHKKGGDNDGKD